jgi:hypothetical protein
MPFTPLIAATQLVGLPSTIQLTDNSTGSDVNITSRKVTITKADGTFYENGVTWALVNTTVSYDILLSDQAVNILVQWVDASNNVLYDFEQLYEFNQYNNQFSVDLTRAILSSPAIMQDNDYWMNKIILRVNIDDADQAVSLADDILLAQAANDRATYMRLNESKYF